MAKAYIKTLTKRDLTERVHEEAGGSYQQSEARVRAIIQVLGDLLAEADPEVRIELRGLGVFEVKKTPANPNARNPRTNEPVFVPSRRKVTYRPGRRIREAMHRPLDD